MSNECNSAAETCTTTASHQGNTECCDMPEKLLCLADEAWREVVKDKIKKEIEKTSGAKLDTLAKLVTETNARRWSHLIQGKQKCDEFKQQVKETLVSLTQ